MTRIPYPDHVRWSTVGIAAVFALVLIFAGVWSASQGGTFGVVFGGVVAAVGALGALAMVLVEVRRLP